MEENGESSKTLWIATIEETKLERREKKGEIRWPGARRINMAGMLPRQGCTSLTCRVTWERFVPRRDLVTVLLYKALHGTPVTNATELS
jgi:hypothetical protein